MSIIEFLGFRTKAAAAPPPPPARISAYPYTTFPRGRRPTDAEVDLILSHRSAQVEAPAKTA